MMLATVRHSGCLGIVSVFVLLSLPTQAGEPIAEAAKAVLETHCYRCHGKDGRNEGGLNVVTDLKKLVDSKRVIAGDPNRSKLLQRVVTGDMPPEFDFEDQAQNPPPLARLTPQEMDAVRSWIQAGAVDVPTKSAERPFITDLDVLKSILDDLRKIPARERRFARYFFLTHLANAGYNEDQLQTYRHGLSKLVNSLSWNKKIKIPVSVDASRTILRIDLRDYLWDEETWQSVVGHYPYGLKHDNSTSSSVCELTGCELPLVRADWFVAAASRPPLYHEVLKLPETIGELEKKLDVDVAANIRQDRVVRAAFNASGVSRNNRLIERHESSNGGYWRSYDFAGNADRRNLFSHPLGPGDGDHDFEYDGGEIIFSLPNGLNGYMLIDAAGTRIEKGPTSIVRDNKQADGAVVNGISCMSCHNRGLIEKADQVREMVAKIKPFDKEVTESIMALYPPREQLDDQFKEDLERFAQAVKKTGAALSRTEPIFVLANQFEEEIGLTQAAAEAGLKVKDFQEILGKTPYLGQSLGLLLVGGTVKRDAYVDAFPKIAEAMHVKMLDAVPVVVATKPATNLPPSPNRSPSGVPAMPQPNGVRGGTPGKSVATAKPGVNPATRPKTSNNAKMYDPSRLIELPESFFGPNDDRFRDVGPVGSVLVGVRVSYKDFFGGPKISSIVPIFRSGSKLLEGGLYGRVNGPEITAVARPGYAIGGLRTKTGLGLDGFEIIYMKVKGDRLDPSDSYNSPWLGDTNGGSPRNVVNPGNLPVGLQGRSTDTVRALGLILLR